MAITVFQKRFGTFSYVQNGLCPCAGGQELSGCKQVDGPLMVVGPFLAAFSNFYLTTAFGIEYTFVYIVSATWLVVLVVHAILISPRPSPGAIEAEEAEWVIKYPVRRCVGH